jgi:threonine aldolase
MPIPKNDIPQKRWRALASDNTTGVHPEILEALMATASGTVPSYGRDWITDDARSIMRSFFGEGSTSFFVYGGTGANVAAIFSVARPQTSVICCVDAHVHLDECGSLERIAGCKLLLVPGQFGKVGCNAVQAAINLHSGAHRCEPSVLTITQPTEMGAVYTQEEILGLSALCRKNGLILHMDGTRLANAAASLGTTLSALTAEAGVDVLSFGGTKNGFMFGEAVVFMDGKLAGGFPKVQKQSMQMPSKMRFVSAQFIRYLSNELWKKIADHANSMGRHLAVRLQEIEGLSLVRDAETNLLFAQLPPSILVHPDFREISGSFCEGSVIRFVTSFSTTKTEIDQLIEDLKSMACRQ